jgi:mannose-6-phosphate isomerase-like protein (cupin superfamily)
MRYFVTKQGKAWGTTQELFLRQNFSLHLLEVRAGGYCSEHKHERKLNHFTVVSGMLEVRVWMTDDAPPDVTVVGPGESTSVPVGAWHKFKALADTVCIEVYEAAPVEEDIVRRSVGGAA